MIREGLVFGFDYVVVCEGLVFWRFLLLGCGGNEYLGVMRLSLWLMISKGLDLALVGYFLCFWY